MKSFDSRAYSVNDFVEWDKQGQLELNPAFQRRSVWSDKAKSYLIDTILRGKPIPKVFIRQKLNVTTKTSIREVVDGQQRLRTILSFIKDGFEVSKRQNPDHGGLRFSQLPEEVQEGILSYEVAVDLLINLPNAEILDIFGRLNSYAVILNEQEKINASHFSGFKVLADQLGYPYEQPLSSIISDLNDLRTMRNAAAHITTTTQTALDSLAIRIFGQPHSSISLYQLLTSVDPRSQTGETVYLGYRNRA